MSTKMHYGVFAALFICGLGISNAVAANAANGERLARRWCSSCHMVAANQPGPTT